MSRRTRPPRAGGAGSDNAGSDSADSADSVVAAAKATAAPVRRAAVSWYPGHMLTAQRRLSAEVQHADAVLELRDARLPLTSGNPALLRIVGARPRLLLLNKAALADPAATRAWLATFAREGVTALALDADSLSGLNLIFPPLKALTADWAARYQRRHMRPPPLRLMVVGMPNVGKSTFINRLIRARRLKTAPTPGVTRGVTWVPLRGDTLLMDSPGVMLPRIADERDALRLGWIGALPDAALGAEALALALLAHLLPSAAAALDEAYALHDPPAEPAAWLDALCHARGFLEGGGRPSRQRGAEALLGDFRAGRLGRYTLEHPPRG
jgi:ribosome biogenesis GTPase A